VQETDHPETDPDMQTDLTTHPDTGTAIVQGMDITRTIITTDMATVRGPGLHMAGSQPGLVTV